MQNQGKRHLARGPLASELVELRNNLASRSGFLKLLWTPFARFGTLPTQFNSEYGWEALRFHTPALVREMTGMMDSRVMKLILLGLAFTCIFGQKLQAQTMDSQAAKSSQTVGGTPQLHQDSEVRQTSWPSIPLPKISMPKVWMPDMSPLTGPVKSGFNKVSTGTKRAWEGTKEIFTLGGDKSSHSANGQSASEKPGFWSKMFTSEPEPVDGPQTVGEWMAQPRLDP